MSNISTESGKQEIMDAQTALLYANRSDPVINSLCIHLDAVIHELSRQRMINYIIEGQLHHLGIDLIIEE